MKSRLKAIVNTKKKKKEAWGSKHNATITHASNQVIYLNISWIHALLRYTNWIDFFTEILSDFTQVKFSLQVYTLDIRLFNNETDNHLLITLQQSGTGDRMVMVIYFWPQA